MVRPSRFLRIKGIYAFPENAVYLLRFRDAQVELARYAQSAEATKRSASGSMFTLHQGRFPRVSGVQ
jgi:hypothetical protein